MDSVEQLEKEVNERVNQLMLNDPLVQRLLGKLEVLKAIAEPSDEGPKLEVADSSSD
jgi:hypothetical protein|tara:strand:+ start:109 stop:279 length:171 start_codon:yes stop_codon:yes gene_type:complete